MRLYTFLRFIVFFFWLPDAVDNRRHHFHRIRLIVSRLRIAVGLIIAAIATGITGYIWIENASFFEAYYMTVITLASVGFSEVFPLSFAGRLFTSGLILFNIGLFAYSVSTITGIFAEGGFTKILSEFTMLENIRALTGHTIVCGFGRHATEVCQELQKQGSQFVVVEKDPEKIEYLRDFTNYLFLEGDATEDETLEEANIKNAAAIVVTLPSDADNLFIVLSARQISAGLRIVSRANSEADEAKIKRAGADHVVMPERIGGFYMATLINKPDLVEFFNLLSNMGPSNVVFEEIPVQQLLPKFQNRSIEESQIEVECRIPVVALRHPGGQYELNPPRSKILRPETHIVVFGNPDQMAKFRDLALAENEKYG